MLIENQSLANATNVVIRDQIPVNATYVTGSLTVNDTPQTDVLDTDAGDFNVTTSGGISARFASFPASGSATVTFRVTVDSDTPAGFHIANLATSESDTTLLRSSNIVSINVFRACTAGNQCPTTFCVDGVCCDTACGGGSTTDCLACSVAAGAAANGTCSPLTGNSCNDGNLCTQTDTCQAGTCTGSNPVVCPEPDQCHDVGACNTTSGICSNPNKPNGTGCDDNNACTQTDTCQAGTCTGSNPVVCTALDQCHQAGLCDTITGQCSNPNQFDGIACDDDNACTQTDTCQNGECVGADSIVCLAQDECHDSGTCTPSSGICSNPIKPDNTACDFNLGYCVSGVCQPNVNPPCNDRDHDGICDAFDICPDDPTNTCHTCPDADNDGICDVVDPCPNDPTNTCQACTDTDHDGICDNVDPCPNDPTNTCSACRDTADPDGDGLPNCVDPCPNDPTNACIPCPDRDHDGICDSRDLCPDDPQNKCTKCPDRDNDGICDALDPCPDNPDPTCTCTDTDGDGICDQADPCPNDPTNTCSACRDTADPDNDGLPNCVDPCPHDSTNTCMNLQVSGGGCNCGTMPTDFGSVLPLLLGLLFLGRYRHRGEQSTANHLPR